MRFLGIDQSFTSTGIVVLDDYDSLIHHEVISTKKSDDALQIFQRMITISTQVIDIIKTHDIKSIAIEGLSFMSKGDATRNLAGLQGALVSSIIQKYPNDIVTIVAPPTLKKYATGSGKAKKEDIFDSLPTDIKELFGKIPVAKGRYDLSDAYWLASYAATKYQEIQEELTYAT